MVEINEVILDQLGNEEALTALGQEAQANQDALWLAYGHHYGRKC